MSTFLNWIIVWLIEAIVIAGVAYILPGVKVKNFGTALLVAVVLALVNLLIRPFIAILALPITIFTFGLFAFVINAFMVMITSAIVKDFKVDGFVQALLFSIIISLVRILLLSFLAV